MDWLIRGLEWMLNQYGSTTTIVCGSTALSLIVVIAVLWLESKAKNRKDK